MVKIYVDDKVDDFIIREFDENTPNSEFIWHRDKENRKVQIIEGLGWFFQIDNSLPIELRPGDEFIIEKMKYHRIIKGKSKLKITIKEY